MSATTGRRRYSCTACGALLCGIAVLRSLIGDQPAQHIWTAADDTQQTDDTGRCAFCFNHMRPSPTEDGRMWICKTCEVVWLDKEALAALPSETAARSGLTAENLVSHCENCGAPIEHSWDEQCEYCGAALSPPTKVVVVENSTDQLAGTGPGAGRRSGWHIAGEVIGGIVEGMTKPGWR